MPDAAAQPANDRPVIRVFGRRVPLPRSKALRVSVGLVLTVFGLFGFLPILGYWMIPIGLMVLSIDMPGVRRFRRRMEVRLVPLWRRVKQRWSRWRRT